MDDINTGLHTPYSHTPLPSPAVPLSQLTDWPSRSVCVCVCSASVPVTFVTLGVTGMMVSFPQQ